jgi:flavin reductase (DIM6/NTAB) family NADH-FMN oxidoreductase RutF
MTDASPTDPKELRKALGCFLTGVTVVTSFDRDGAPRGFTANSFTSVSLDPPLVLVCIAYTAGSYDVFEKATHYAVNILSESQRVVSGVFAARAADKFAGLAWRRGPAGSPILPDTVAWLDCVVHERMPAGDHLILLGRVVGFEHTPHTPLGYCRGNYLSFGLEQTALSAAHEARIRVGVILEREGRILFLEDPATGTLILPSAASLGRDKAEKGSLKERMNSLGITAEIEFLYAVFEGPGHGTHSVFYRGDVTATVPIAGVATTFFPLAEIPWDRLSDDAVRGMLRRYVGERLEDTFGIYVGTVDTGTVKVIDRQS